MDDEESVSERVDGERKAKTQRALGRETSGVEARPKGLVGGAKPAARPAGVGLRTARPMSEDEGTAAERRVARRERLSESRDSHRRGVWEKLDAARRVAEEKTARVDRFKAGPGGGAAAPPPPAPMDDDDG